MNVKLKLIKLLALVMMLISGREVFGQNNTMTVTGKIKGLEDQTMRIVIWDKSEPRGSFVDSAVIKSGSFSLTTRAPSLQVISFYIQGTPFNGPQLQFVASPGAKIQFKGSYKDGQLDVYPFGDKPNHDLMKLNRESLFPLMYERIEVSKRVRPTTAEMMQGIREKPDADPADKKKLEQLDEDILLAKKNFIKKNSSSVISAWLLSDMMVHMEIENDEAAGLFNTLNMSRLKDFEFYRQIDGRVKGYYATASGKTIPDLVSEHTYDGNKFDLASLRGKYVVLDFWGTWCGPCISGMPKMKEYLDKYSGKMEIVGVASESDDGTKWREFLKKNSQYDWHQILSRDDEDFIVKFNVIGFPTKIIIDPEGKVVERFVGEDDAIYNKLDALLN